MKIGITGLAALIVGCAAAFSALGETGKTMSVQVQSAPLKEKPSPLGAVRATLSYADRVQVLEEQGPWLKVSATGGATGWIHQSALSTKRIVLKSGDQNAQVAASSDELALAGKGFNSDVEAQFKAKHKDIDFAWVDKMLQLTLKPNDLMAFLKAGSVEPKGGAR